MIGFEGSASRQNIVATKSYKSSFSQLSGGAYFESVCCGPSVALLSWHAPFIRCKYGRLGMICLAGPPNYGKTKELMVSYYYHYYYYHHYWSTLVEANSTKFSYCCVLLLFLQP